MIVKVIYDASTANAPAGFFTAVQAAVQFFERTITDPVSISLEFGYGSVAGKALVSGALAASQTTDFEFSKQDVLDALVAHASSEQDLSAIAQLLKSTSPDEGVVLTESQARTLDLTRLPSGGSIGLSSTEPFTYDPSHRGVAGKYDAIGVLEHEIAGVLGQISLAPDSTPGQPLPPTLLDLYRYSNGLQDPTAPNGVFSLNGSSQLGIFNNPANGGDPAGWTAGAPDAFDAFATIGVALPVTAKDDILLGALGYQTPQEGVANYPAAYRRLLFEWAVGRPDANTVKVSTTSGGVVSAGQTLSIQSPVGFDDLGTFEDSGAVSIAGNAAQVIGVWIEKAGSAPIAIAAGATFSVTNPGGAAFGVAGNINWTQITGGHTTNAGTFTVSAADDAVGVRGYDLYFQFTNQATGVISVVSASGNAVGVDQGNPLGAGFGRPSLINNGTISVSGAQSAAGVLIEAPSGGTVTNNGEIVASSPSAKATTVGIGVAGAYQGLDSGHGAYEDTPFTVNNTGTITAQIAIFGGYVYDIFPAESPSVVVDNSGVLNGDVDLASYTQVINNTGTIQGDIRFAETDTAYAEINGATPDSVYDYLATSTATYAGSKGVFVGSLYLGYGVNKVTLGKGHAVVYGGGGADTIVGGTGADVIELFHGNNKINGGGGFNTLSFAGAAGGVTVNLALGTASAGGTDSIKNIEEVIGSDFSDTLIAGPTSATLIGGLGRDTLRGGAGNDTLVAGAGGWLTGGGGNNTFVYSAGDHGVNITDFGAGGDQDVLDIDGYTKALSITQQGADTFIRLAPGDAILLKNVQASELSARDLSFRANPYKAAGQPTSVPVFGTRTIVYDSDFTVAAREVLSEANQRTGLMVEGFSDDVFPVPKSRTLTVLGQIDVTQAIGDVVGLGEAEDDDPGPSNSVLDVGSSGAFSVSASAGAATGVLSGVPTVLNAGAFSVTGAGDAVGVSAGMTFDNAATGAFTVTSTAGTATGISLQGTGQAFTNDGVIDISGAGATVALQLAASRSTSIVNSGHLIVTGLGASPQTVGVDVSGGTIDPVTIVNSGLISASVAITEDPEALQPASAPYMTIDNSGVIDGAIDLGPGESQITNTGTIVGDIRFGDEASSYEGVGGHLTGAIRLGYAHNTAMLGDDAGVIYGGGGDDAIIGGKGNDFIEISRGDNTIDGGGGFNILSFADSDAAVSVVLGSGFANGPGHTTIKNVQEVIGSNFGGVLEAGPTSAKLIAGSGKTKLIGGGGNDTLVAGAGGDTMVGGGGADTFMYSAGDHDLVISDFGQGGADVLHVFGYASAKSEAQQGADTLITLDTGDEVLLTNVKATSLTAANLIFTASRLPPARVPPTAPVFGSATLTVTSDFEVFAHETLRPSSLSADAATGDYYGVFFRDVHSDGEGTANNTLDNHGSIVVSHMAGNVDGIVADSSDLFRSSAVVNEAGGAIRVASGFGAATGLLAQDESPEVRNSGTFRVDARTNAYGLNISAPGSSDGLALDNTSSGALTVASTHGAAYGVRVLNSARVENDGVIQVTGAAAAYGIEETNFSSILNNSGTLSVSTTAVGGKSYGIAVDGWSGAAAISPIQNIVNSGTISAQTAIWDFDAGSTPQAFTSLNIDNTGEIDGAINLGGSYSEVLNDGTINGDILLFYGSDLVDLRAGVTNGTVIIDPTDRTGETTAPQTVPGVVSDTVYTGGAASRVRIVGGDPKLGISVIGDAGGHTTVQFDISTAGVTETQGANGAWIIDAGTDGEITVTNVQALQFTNKTVAPGSLPSGVAPSLPAEINQAGSSGSTDGRSVTLMSQAMAAFVPPLSVSVVSAGSYAQSVQTLLYSGQSRARQASR